MIVTEEEAKAKWCPMSRVIHPQTGTTANRFNHVDPSNELIHGTTCIGPRCMMWKDKGKRMKRINAGLGWYNESLREKNNVPESWVFVESEHADDMAYWEQPAAEADNVGCCGLIPRHE